MKAKAFLFVFMLTFLLMACATGEKITRLNPGMSKQKVESVLGKPDGYSAPADGYEVYKYTNRLISGWSWDRADFNVIFKDGKVQEYGAGEVRTKQGGVNTILFISP
ncbi:hypothetical protein BMS3Abin14_00678 [bacterium BMS3Abin14]|nr:hypothetical protein BMS3Abin14_00678 [bacterium BMS3Abin14]